MDNNEGKAPVDVLVTGSSGHLGTALMLALPTMGHHPVGVDILPSETTTHVGDISDRAFVSSVISQHPTIQHIVHAATLHKPHVGSHRAQDFVDTNVTGTLVMLEAAATLVSSSSSSSSETSLRSFVFVSTTSAFGAALSPAAGKPAVWINEGVTPVPKNIYGATKCAAEDLCRLAASQHGLPVVVLRTSRFFPEEDDDEDRRAAMDDENLKVLELAYRRCDIADVVSACRRAMLRAADLGWAKFIVSAPPPFPNDAETLRLLDSDPAQVMRRVCAAAGPVFDAKGWKFLARIDRVYDSSRAVEVLGWEPQYTFAKTVEAVAEGREWRSELALRVGKKGYHAESHGVYTKR